MNNGQETGTSLPGTAPAQQSQNPQAVSAPALQPVQTSSLQGQVPTSEQKLQVIGQQVGGTQTATIANNTSFWLPAAIFLVFVMLALLGARWAGQQK